MIQISCMALVVSQKRDISLKSVFFHIESAPLPSSLFVEYGFLRKSTKSNIASYTGDDPVNLHIIDGDELLITFHGQRQTQLQIFLIF